MRALPHLDIPSPAVPPSAEAPSRGANRGEAGSFAATLQRKSAGDPAPARPDHADDQAPPAARTAPAADGAEPPVAAQRKPDGAADADAAPVAAETDQVQEPAVETVDPSALAAALALPAPLIPAAPLAVASPDAGAATAAAPLPVGPQMPDVAVAAAVTPPVADGVLPPTAPPLPAVPAAATAPGVAGADADAAANALLAQVGSAPSPAAQPTDGALADVIATAMPAVKPTPVGPGRASTAPVAAAADANAAAAAAAAASVAGAPLAAVTPSEGKGDSAQLPLRETPALKPGAPKSSDEVAAAAAALAPTTVSPATPATQSAGMHAVAAALGGQDAKPKEDEAPSVVVPHASEPLATALPAAPTAPVAPATPVRAMSETVLAQNALAANGNAMEKAVSNQISKALIQHQPNGDRMLVLRLTPPELGTVKIEVVERMGVLSARLHAEDDGVRQALERFLPSMRQDLRASDAPIHELTLSDQTQFQRSFADGQNQQRQDADRPGRRARSDAPGFSLEGVRSEPVPVARTVPLGGRIGAGGVDVRA